MRGAGGGRPAKPVGQKVNRHASTKRSVALPLVAPVGDAPDPVVELSAAGAAIWRDLWAEPEASQWRPVDVPALSRMVWLQSTPEHWADPRLLAEMRQLEDRFGLNAQGRKNLGWEYHAPDLSPATAGTTTAPSMKDRGDAAMRLIHGAS